MFFQTYGLPIRMTCTFPDVQLNQLRIRCVFYSSWFRISTNKHGEPKSTPANSALWLLLQALRSWGSARWREHSNIRRPYMCMNNDDVDGHLDTYARRRAIDHLRWSLKVVIVEWGAYISVVFAFAIDRLHNIPRLMAIMQKEAWVHIRHLINRTIFVISSSKKRRIFIKKHTHTHLLPVHVRVFVISAISNIQ